MHKFKTVVKKIVISNPKGAWLFGAFKGDGIRGVFFEIILTTLIKVGLDGYFRIRKQAFFLYKGSKHLRLFEKFMAAEKDSKKSVLMSPGKDLLKKGILPIEEI